MPNDRRLRELALKGLEAERAKLEDEIAEIRRQLNNKATASGNTTKAFGTSQPSRPAKRTMSAAARKRISEGMKRRYAALRKAAQVGKK
jgi:flagellin-like hook-associated protein FlgL